MHSERGAVLERHRADVLYSRGAATAWPARAGVSPLSLHPRRSAMAGAVVACVLALLVAVAFAGNPTFPPQCAALPACGDLPVAHPRPRFSIAVAFEDGNFTGYWDVVNGRGMRPPDAAFAAHIGPFSWKKVPTSSRWPRPMSTRLMSTTSGASRPRAS